MSSRPRIAIVTNIAWNIYNFRRGLAIAIKNAGYDPILIAADDSYGAKLSQEGWDFVPVNHLERTGVNPIKDLMLFNEFIKIYKEYNISFALHYNAKPLVYASLAAAFLEIPFIPNITGLAGPFSGNRKLIAFLVTKLYRWALNKSEKVVFQNNEDLEFFVKNKIINLEKAILIEGSGVNMDNFKADLFEAPSDENTVFLMFARLSRAKGVEEYVNAARFIKNLYPKVTFKLAGPFDSDKLAIRKEEVEEWVNEGVIEYLGVSDFIQREISKAHAIVYPSYYREGVPKSLIESAAMSKPIITTDNVGCREVVRDGVNGYLIPVRDSASLAAAFTKFINLDKDQRDSFGEESRKIATSRFDEKIVIEAYMKLINRSMLITE
ncbi:glycosyltransferase family 4 protein [Mucilaginibacter gynuensis]|uniref:Glycosyltransferase family 4 protein n=1 Tax=Mucilaginibacter gynuensis TaxID=1302236 RepID=A0ABP8GXI7_9SPHI